MFLIIFFLAKRPYTAMKDWHGSNRSRPVNKQRHAPAMEDGHYPSGFV